MTAKATLTLHAGDGPDDDLRITVAVHDRDLVGHEAEFQVFVETEVHDRRAIDEDKVLYRRKLRLAGHHELGVPRAKVRAYTYSGPHLDLVLHARLVVDDSLLFDTKISERLALELGMKVPVTTDAKTLVEPPDGFLFFRNLAAIPAHNQVVTLALAVVGGLVMAVSAIVGIHDQFVPESATWLFSHYDSDGDSSSPLAAGLTGSGVVGTAVWFMIRAQLRRYMKFHLRRLPQRIRPGDRVRAASLFEGRSRVPLRGVTLRVVASNLECGQYRRGSGTSTRTVSFREPVRGVVLYEKRAMQIPAQVPLAGYFPGEVDFDRMFATLYPPFKLSSSHGVDVHWEIQLLHPEFVDQELEGPTELFAYEDFLRG